MIKEQLLHITFLTSKLSVVFGYKNIKDEKEKDTMMNKTDVIKRIAEETGFTQKDTKVVIEALQKVVFEALPSDDVKIMDGVTLCSVHKEARMGRNPQTGETVEIPAKNAPKCKFGKAIKEAIN